MFLKRKWTSLPDRDVNHLIQQLQKYERAAAVLSALSWLWAISIFLLLPAVSGFVWLPRSRTAGTVDDGLRPSVLRDVRGRVDVPTTIRQSRQMLCRRKAKSRK
jgi:hypothetical protein